MWADLVAVERIILYICDRVLAVREKFNRITCERTTPVTERYVYALFPHLGSNPCWYG
jgi:hypothetical protein